MCALESPLEWVLSQHRAVEYSDTISLTKYLKIRGHEGRHLETG